MVPKKLERGLGSFAGTGVRLSPRRPVGSDGWR